MTKESAKLISVAVAVSSLGFVTYLAYSRPGYFTSEFNLGGLVFLEMLLAAVWLYRKTFFTLVIISFLFAGVDLPFTGPWTMGRWVVLSVGALVGLVMILRERRFSFGMFHVLAILCVLSALTSAAVSRYSTLSSLKVLSLFLLFLYSATGARLAVVGRENRFFTGLLLGSEVFVAIITGFYLLGREVMGNPNSLGAVMGVVAAPILLWGTLVDETQFAHRRRLFLFVISMYLTFGSHARAGILAALFACGLLCLALRRYVLLAQGVMVLAALIAAAAIFQPEAFSRSVSSFTSNVVYKGKDPGEGLLGSRKSPWQETIDVIHQHFWFGTGFGTSDNGQDATENLGKFASTSATAMEHGSSYLEILAWVGMLGVWPFVLLVGLLSARLIKAFRWMFKTANPSHPIVPLTILVTAGLIHAVFEDWLFAPGYYLCVFFWAVAFVFVDQLSSVKVYYPRPIFSRPVTSMPDEFGAAAPTR